MPVTRTKQAQCANCNAQKVLYTCPGCNTRSCSAACSVKHKELTSCSGQRNKAAYVPMNQYTWGDLMDDYTYLEEMRRTVSHWNDDINSQGVAKGLQTKQGKNPKHTRLSARQKKTAGKRESLQAHLLDHDIRLDFLPLGMQRRTTNRSGFDPKTSAISLTIEFILVHPFETIQYKHLTHSNDVTKPLQELIKLRFADQMPKNKPKWLKDTEMEEVASQIYLMEEKKMRRDPPLQFQRRWRRLDGSLSLLDVFKGSGFIEYPSIYVWREDSPNLKSNEDGSLSVSSHGAPGADEPRVSLHLRSLQALVDVYETDDDDSTLASEKPQEQRSGASGSLGNIQDYGSDDSTDDDSDVPFLNTERKQTQEEMAISFATLKNPLSPCVTLQLENEWSEIEDSDDDPIF